MNPFTIDARYSVPVDKSKDEATTAPDSGVIMNAEIVAIALGELADDAKPYNITAFIEGSADAFINADSNGDGSYSITESGLPSELKGQGVGLAMYQKLIQDIIQRGYTVTSGTSVSMDAQRIYKALEKRGYAVKQNPKATMDKETGTLESDGPVFAVTRSNISELSSRWFGDDVKVTQSGNHRFDYSSNGILIAMGHQEGEIGHAMDAHDAKKGTGVATKLFLMALEDFSKKYPKAQYVSEQVMSNETHRLFARLQEVGIPFYYENGFYRLDSYQIQSIEFDEAQTALSGKHRKPVGASVRREADQTDTPAFKAWFGDSRVLDADGRALVMYHATYPWEKDGRQLGNITTFDRMASVSIVGRQASIDNIGNWFSTNPGNGDAQMYGDTIYPVYLCIKNPMEPPLV